ncbi:MAG: signal peptidase I [Candidatus Bathyarchaeia archaeon]
MFSSVFTVLLTVVLVFTVLSRFGYLNIMGVSVVFSDSMEPSLRRGDLIIYANMNYSVGDVVVYCVTPSHCVVHRVIGFISLDTVSGNRVKVVTKGDNADVADSPVDVESVRGKAVLAVPRELWIPVVIALLAYSLYFLAKTPVAGLSYLILFIVGFASIAAVYAIVPKPIVPNGVNPPVLNLAGVYFDRITGIATVRYTGELSLTSIEVTVNSTSVDVTFLGEREFTFKPSPNLLREAFEGGKPLLIHVNATSNHVGRLSGEYTLLIGGLNPDVSSVNGAIVLKNPNCFPLKVNISIKYLSGYGWMWRNQTYIIEGFSYLVVEVPEAAEMAYAYIYWFNQGSLRWVGIPVKRG